MKSITSVATLGLLFFAAACAVAYGQPNQPCAEFSQLVKSTYNFRPALLANESEREKKSAAMDKVWETVKARKTELVPCLRTALTAADADRWFLFDGSNLLVSIDPSEDSKKLQIKNFAATNLDDVDLRVWVGTLVRRGIEGFDVSAPAAIWMAYPKAEYFLPQHGAYKVSSLVGGFFIYGSMDENYATPALLKIASDANHPARERALAILLFQATPEAFQALQAANSVGRSSDAQEALLTLLRNPRRIEPRDKPKTTREEFLKAFNGIVNDDWDHFRELVGQVTDGERDVVAVMKPEDVPLLRKVRRKILLGANQHSFAFYKTFSDILTTLVWKPEFVK